MLPSTGHGACCRQPGWVAGWRVISWRLSQYVTDYYPFVTVLAPTFSLSSPSMDDEPPLGLADSTLPRVLRANKWTVKLDSR